MDKEIEDGIAHLLSEMQAMRLIVNEALAVALSHESNPDNAIVYARQDIENIIQAGERKAKDDGTYESRQTDFARIRASLKNQLDAIEKRLSLLLRHRVRH
jgi:hypothetical protein